MLTNKQNFEYQSNIISFFEPVGLYIEHQINIDCKPNVKSF